MKKLLVLTFLSFAFSNLVTAQVIKDTIIIRSDKGQARKDTTVKLKKRVLETRIDTLRFGADSNHIEKSIIIMQSDNTDGSKEKNIKVIINGKESLSIDGAPLMELLDLKENGITSDTLKIGEKTIITRKGRILENKEYDLKTDTLKIGNTTIITRQGRKLGKGNIEEMFELFKDDKKKEKSLKNIENSWFVLDLGFSQYRDNTNYGSTFTTGITSAGINKDKMKLNTLSSRNVNIWFLMQRLNLAQHKLNLKYGFGIELNNYRFDQSDVLFRKNPTYISVDYTSKASKAKLAADYLTVPLLLNFNSTPEKNNGLRFSAGISAGFLYSARFKTKTSGDIQKTKSDFDLEPFKLSWTGELGFGNIDLYGGFAMNNMWSKGLDMKPYTIGLRFGTKPESEKKKKSSPKKPTVFKWGEML